MASRRGVMLIDSSSASTYCRSVEPASSRPSRMRPRSSAYATSLLLEYTLSTTGGSYKTDLRRAASAVYGQVSHLIRSSEGLP